MQNMKYLVVTIMGLWFAGCSFDPSSSPSFEPSEDTSFEPFDIGERERDAGDTLDVSVPSPDMPAAVDMADVSVDMEIVPDMSAPDMPSSMRTCDGQLVDVTTSNSHCGECGNSCDETFGVCRSGSCECYDPYTACGVDNICTYAEYDAKNCGVCGATCGANEVCFEGDCVCYPGFKRCNGVCVDIDADPRHCGDCGIGCNGGICKEGQCENRDSCGLTWFECPVQNGGTACVRPRANPAYCGATILDECGDPCGPSEICYRQGAFENFECREFRPAVGCTSCPCGNCEGEFCIESDEVDDVVFCVKD